MLRIGSFWDVLDYLRELLKKVDVLELIKAVKDLYVAIENALADGKFDFPEDAIVLLERLKAILEVLETEAKFKQGPELAPSKGASLARLRVTTVVLAARCLLEGRTEEARGLLAVLRKWEKVVPATGKTVGETFGLMLVGELRNLAYIEDCKIEESDEELLPRMAWLKLQIPILHILRIILVAILAIIDALSD